MPTSTNVTNLKINTLTKAQYNTAVQGGVIGANELSIITDLDDAIQVSTLPTAAAGEEGKIYQFIGTTDANYTHGYFYECVSDGQNPATYSWTQTDVQPAPSGLPSQTGNAGKFLTTDGTDASWSDKPLVNTATAFASIGIKSQSNSNKTTSVCIGYNAKCNGNGSLVIGTNGGDGTIGGGNNSITIGRSAVTNADGSIMIGAKTIGTVGSGAIYIGTQNSGRFSVGRSSICLNTYGSLSQDIPNGVFAVGLYPGVYTMLNSDGTIPTDRFTTTPVADGTYVPTLTISSGTATRTWGAAASAPVVPATMPTLAVADWSSNTQTVNVTGVTASNIVFVSPAPASAADYAAAGILCTAQGSGTLTFTCTTVPSNAITVNVVILG